MSPSTGKLLAMYLVWETRKLFKLHSSNWFARDKFRRKRARAMRSALAVCFCARGPRESFQQRCPTIGLLGPGNFLFPLSRTPQLAADWSAKSRVGHLASDWTPMETLIASDARLGARQDERQLNDASEHGLAWSLLNELLHVIMFIYTLYGMIQFPVKFIKKRHLVDWAAKVIIAHSWYLSIKFAAISLALFLFNWTLDRHSIEMEALNCSFANYHNVLRARARNTTNSTANHRDDRARDQMNLLVILDHLPDFARALDALGGPFRLLDNRATLIYGVWSISIYIMLAIFPFELMYFVSVDYNFIRYVLGDPNCLLDLYDRRDKHLLRLASWSRLQADSLLTKGAKMILSQRDLRSNYASAGLIATTGCTQPDLPAASLALPSDQLDYKFHLELFPEQLISDELLVWPPSDCSGERADEHQQHSAEKARLWRLPSIGTKLRSKVAGTSPSGGAQWANAVGQPRHHHLGSAAYRFHGVKQLKTRLAINHYDRPSYRVSVANRNLKKFRPFVRSEVWFKASMIIYPIFITFYCVTFVVILGLIEYFFECSLWETIRRCKLATSRLINEPVRGQQQASTFAEWSFWDKLIYYETIYTVLILGCASSFYCSYYFGTIYELHMWIRELSQQLVLSAQVIELTDVLAHSNALSPIQVRRHLPAALGLDQCNEAHYVNDFGGLNELYPCLRDLKRKYAHRLRWLLGLRVSGAGGNRFMGPISKYRHREQMAIRLLTKKETLLRATYVNMCLFFDELHDTRYMTTTILRRTTQMAAAYAFMVSITRSQYKLNSGEYWYLNSLLIGVLLVFNLYLASAACINNGVNKMLVKMHSLIVASIRTGSEDADLFEFWLRHVGSFGEDKDVTAYCIYGYKVTWSTIINFDSVIVTLFFLTTD